MIRRPQLGAYVIVAVVVLATGLLALLGVIGRPDRHERFDAKRYEISPAGESYPDGILVEQVIDQDFGTEERHGFQLNVANTYGAPMEVTASSPDAPDDLEVVNTELDTTRIRIGDPETTISGQHRYELSYIQPRAGITGDRLELSVINAGEELATDRFEVVVNGFELAGATCDYGTEFDKEQCQFETGDDGVSRAVVEPLDTGEGIFVTGDVAAITTPVDLEDPPLPDRTPDRRLVTALAALVAAALTAIVANVIMRRRGRNEVFAGGAADAAFTAFGDGALPPPGTATTLVSDARLGDLATIEFIPPKSIEPWEGALLLGEEVTDRSVGAWFSAKSGDDVITMTKEPDGDLVITDGAKRADVDGETREILDEAFQDRESIHLDGSYDKHFARAWGDVRELQAERLAKSGWWKRPPSGSVRGGTGRRIPAAAFIGLGVWALFLFGAGAVRVLGMFRSFPGAILFAVIATAIAAYLVFRAFLPARSAVGSALALRTESFRRFLEQSEGKHVEWAWDNGLIRQYTAWAVALDAADAWQRALASSNVPPVEYDATGPLMVYTMSSTFHRSSVPPAPSGGGGGFGGGGFSGGSIGGGGGGGGGGSSSGSW